MSSLSSGKRPSLTGREDLATSRHRLLAQLQREIRDARVLKAMAKVPREFFVSEESRALAYEDRPLPIGYDQTISQPFMVAWMTSALGLRGQEKVLEVGTGSGYHTAILAELASRIVSVERLKELADRARELLNRLGYTNIEIHLAGDILGWLQEAPYHAILVSAGAPHIPTGLVEQLDSGGRLVIPVGSRYEQELVKVTRLANRHVVERLGGCRFVPLIGPEAWEDN